MTKKIGTKTGLAVLSAVLFMLLLVAMAQSASTAVTVSLADVTAESGDVVTVPIIINNMTDYGSATVKIGYDHAVVHITGVTGGPESQVAAKYTDNTIGYTAVSAANQYGASGNIIFANVEFTAVGTGSTQLDLTVDSLYDRVPNDIPRNVSSGLFMVGSYPRGDLDHNDVAADAADVAMMIDASVGDITPNPEYDLDGNGNNADAADVAMMIDASVGDITL